MFANQFLLSSAGPSIERATRQNRIRRECFHGDRGSLALFVEG
jgi:hypothetical protein